MDLIKSPMNYIGNKYRILPQIQKWFPDEIDTMVDIFSGGGDVVINTKANKKIANDINFYVIQIFQEFQKHTEEDILSYIDDTIKSLDSLDIKNAQVVDFRTLAKDVLGLSRDVMVDSLKIASNPQDAELQKGLQTKVQDLMQKSQNLLSSQNELKTKFGIK